MVTVEYLYQLERSLKYIGIIESGLGSSPFVPPPSCPDVTLRADSAPVCYQLGSIDKLGGKHDKITLYTI
jgi:hypothetical protein